VCFRDLAFVITNCVDRQVNSSILTNSIDDPISYRGSVVTSEELLKIYDFCSVDDNAVSRIIAFIHTPGLQASKNFKGCQNLLSNQDFLARDQVRKLLSFYT
jgi:hypothetical protein